MSHFIHKGFPKSDGDLISGIGKIEPAQKFSKQLFYLSRSNPIKSAVKV